MKIAEISGNNLQVKDYTIKTPAKSGHGLYLKGKDIKKLSGR